MTRLRLGPVEHMSIAIPIKLYRLWRNDPLRPSMGSIVRKALAAMYGEAE